MKHTKKLWLTVAVIVIIGLIVIACGDDPENGSNTLTLTPNSVTISDENLTATSTIGGTTTGTITLNTTTLPVGVTAEVIETTIIVTGIHQTTAINDNYTVSVSRGGLTQNLSIVVNLIAAENIEFIKNNPIVGAPVHVGDIPFSLDEGMNLSNEQIIAITATLKDLKDNYNVTAFKNYVTSVMFAQTDLGISLDVEGEDAMVTIRIATTADAEAIMIALEAGKEEAYNAQNPYEPFVIERFGIRFYAEKGTDRAAVQATVNNLPVEYEGFDEWVASWGLTTTGSQVITIDTNTGKASVTSSTITNMINDLDDAAMEGWEWQQNNLSSLLIINASHAIVPVTVFW